MKRLSFNSTKTTLRWLRRIPPETVYSYSDVRGVNTRHLVVQKKCYKAKNYCKETMEKYVMVVDASMGAD